MHKGALMNDAIDVTESHIAEKDTLASARFYVVSPRKFVVLFIGTLSLYAFYWFYKQWACLRDTAPEGSDDRDIWPSLRAIFALFFVHSLFREVRQHSVAGSALNEWENGAHATFIVILMLATSTLDRLSARNIGSPITDYLFVFLMLPLLFLYCKAQGLINIACGDPAGATNHKLTRVNYGWLALGTVAWLLILAGLVLPPDVAA
jgi:hypothetical protein